jgi:hypothetical protein
MKPDSGQPRERRLELDRLDAVEIPPERPGGLAHICTRFHEDAETVLSRRVTQQASLWRVTMTVASAPLFLHGSAETVERRDPGKEL